MDITVEIKTTRLGLNMNYKHDIPNERAQG